MIHYSKEWWNAQVLEYGDGFESADLSMWSSIRRYRSINRYMDNYETVADICGGVGNFGRWRCGDSRYMLVDFSQEALKLSDADIKILATMPDDYDKVLERCKEEKIDWIVFCSVFVVPEAFKEMPPCEVMRKAFDSARIGVIGNYRDKEWPREPHLNTYDIGEEMAALADLNPSLDRTFMPNEFNIILKHPGSDWHTKEQAAEWCK